jgi:NAD(P)-dependent dehydrogenase (short-subunit alcohol dehydrogenase family)
MSKTILITGSSSGIGKASAIYFSQKGWKVAATMRNPEKETELNTDSNISIYQLDVSNPASVMECVKKVLADLGQIDVLLNNAGYGLVGPLETASEDTVNNQFQTNVFGLIRTIQAVTPIMRIQKSGVIINITSIGGLVTFPFNSLYHATKFAVDGLSESIKYELQPFGIKVKTVAPGFVATDFASRSLHFTFNEGEEGDYKENLAGVWKAFEKGMPDAISPEKVAETIYNAATDDTDQLRYLAGPDAEQTYAAWKSMDNEAFFDMIKGNFGM